MIDAPGIISRTGMKMEDTHSIIPKWVIGRVGDELDSHLLLKSGSSGDERYVEWART